MRGRGLGFFGCVEGVFDDAFHVQPFAAGGAAALEEHLVRVVRLLALADGAAFLDAK